MHIRGIESRTPELEEELLGVWGRSVRATHGFLSESDIVRIRACVPEAIHTVEHLAVAEDGTGRILAFMGVTGDRLEMLFVDSDMRGQGIGSSLLNCGISHWGIRELTVNEQNPLAMRFYERRGFVACRRTDTDEEGGPFPLVYMRLAER